MAAVFGLMFGVNVQCLPVDMLDSADSVNNYK